MWFCALYALFGDGFQAMETCGSTVATSGIDGKRQNRDTCCKPQPEEKPNT
jgi:hypothetical protein